MDIRQQQFTVKMFRGFDTQEVDTFLEDLASDYEALLKENSLLKEQLQALEERARREAGVIIREAEVHAERIIEASRTAEGGLRSEILALRRTRRQLAEGLRSTLEMYSRLLDQDIKANIEDEAPSA